MRRSVLNPAYARRLARHAGDTAAVEPPPSGIERVVIGSATLYRADCFDVLPTLAGIDAVVTDPPYGIGFAYRTCPDAPEDYDGLMARLVPELVRATDNGPCFVWQSPLRAPDWHRYFPPGFRIVACCKHYPTRRFRGGHLGWDPVIFWSGRSRLQQELPRNWHVADLRDGEPRDRRNPVPAPKPLESALYLCQSLRGVVVLDPFMGSGTTGVAAILAGKRFVGIERDPVYFRYACERIAQTQMSVDRARELGHGRMETRTNEAAHVG